MTTLLPGQLIVKEGRALAPIWLGAAVAIVAGRGAGMLMGSDGLGSGDVTVNVLGWRHETNNVGPCAPGDYDATLYGVSPGAALRLLMGSLLAFILGAAALGVFSIGHEYGNRTLTSLLAQPLARSRLLLSKVLVLAALLVLLSVVAALVLLRANGIERMLGGDSAASQWRLAIVVLTPLLGLCVAPWLTMVFRNATAGLVFTLAVPSALWIAGQIARAASVDFDFVDLEVGNPFAYEPALVLMTVGLVAISFIAAVHGRALFVGLEALDTPRDLWPSTVKRRPFRKKHAAHPHKGAFVRTVHFFYSCRRKYASTGWCSPWRLSMRSDGARCGSHEPAPISRTIASSFRRRSTGCSLHCWLARFPSPKSAPWGLLTRSCSSHGRSGNSGWQNLRRSLSLRCFWDSPFPEVSKLYCH